MKSGFVILLLVFVSLVQSKAQVDSALFKAKKPLSDSLAMNMDAVRNRPFLTGEKSPVAIGGYVEANWQHIGTDGISEGHQFQFRRLTLFVSSSITQRISFLSEIELEDGGKELAIEFAALDVSLNPLLNLRGGMILNPIGAFNQNHDGPKWEIVDRPIAATQLLPATWSNAGFGLYGKHDAGKWRVGYELYLSGNFDGSIIDNEQNRTFLPAAKANPERFEEIHSGLPLLTTKVALRNQRLGEIGLSYMGGVYNRFEDDGVQLDARRRLDVIALDMNLTIPATQTAFTGEWAWIALDLPENYAQQYGAKQQGGFLDIVQPIVRTNIFNWPDATLNLACRVEYVDWNAGNFRETGGNIAQDLWSIVPAISFRPVPQSVFRINYRWMEERDVLGNPPALTGGWSAGFSSYF